ncbi:hypothetical protein G6045_36830 [Streptomyces sp. YC504]|uniref:Uncharacterized protein n=1 Tax=Streptomyces mesophilus TaxID=1775132 RepID=A0A6G4XUA8_9ACTN|nr:hypothetical protein [Streptomyces mesophilus]NGO81189.1 hypothetical protein [Streptomyces mesophilus]
MEAALTAAAFLLLIALAAYVIHRLNLQHAERIALRTYSPAQAGRRPSTEPGIAVTPPPPHAPLPAVADRHDHRDGGRGRFGARRRRDRTTHKQAR